MNRRELLRAGLMSGGAAVLSSGGARLVSAGLRPGPASAADPAFAPDPAFAAEPVPTSPLIRDPFSQELPVPPAMSSSNVGDWQSLYGAPVPAVDPGQHQIWWNPSQYYRIPMELAPHRFTSSQVQPIDALGNEVTPPDGVEGPRSLPDSTMYCFNGTFPGPRIVARYGQPALVRFENYLEEHSDFGTPSTLTHLHNGHTAPDSDGNPFYGIRPRSGGFAPGESGVGYDSYRIGGNGRWYYDNLYGNITPDDDERERQSFLWFHDHRMDCTSENVYKGLVGLYYLYDQYDSGNENEGSRLPGQDHDIPLVLYDCRFDDGVTRHRGAGQDGRTHPQNWGQLFFAEHPDSGFVGDVFTVNGKVQPYFRVERRKYRFRFLDASVSRWYELRLMSGTPVAAPGRQGQYQLSGATQTMQFLQIASEGGLLPAAILRNSLRIAPSKRREVIIDFTRYQDGSPTTTGDVIYLTNTLQMTTGRKPDSASGSGYAVPLLKFIVGDDPSTPDNSLVPTTLRALPPVPTSFDGLKRRKFEFHRSGGGGWTINGRPFNHKKSFADPPRGSAELWIIRNGGGGWTHPVHLHQEEHRVISRNGIPAPDPGHPDDVSKEDVIALEEGEEVVLYRKFRTFQGRYVAHCHNLAHEDHSMMFGWTIV